MVTGAGSGLGRAAARALAKEGARVAVLDRNGEAAKQVAAELDGALPVEVDIADRESVRAAIAAIAEEYGRVDINLNAAGIGDPGKVLSKNGPLPIASFARVIEVNLIGTFDVMRQCAALMAANEPAGTDSERGVIINVSSGAAFEGQKGQAAYSASKAGLIGLMLPAARDLARNGIRVVTVSPGVFDTAIFADTPPELLQALSGLVLNPPRLGNPDEFAGLAVHIVQNAYLNATNIGIDAGARLPNF